MKSATKKRRDDHGAAWSDESEASVQFYKQGERNAAEEVLAYQKEVPVGVRRRRRGWLLILIGMVVALAAGLATAVYLTPS
jgi:hypothetical protein